MLHLAAWITWEHAKGAVIGGGAVAAGFVAIGALLRRPVRWLWRRNVATPVTAWAYSVLDVHAEPLVSRMDRIDERMARVEREFFPNGGGSMRDQTDRIEKAITATPEDPDT